MGGSVSQAATSVGNSQFGPPQQGGGGTIGKGGIAGQPPQQPAAAPNSIDSLYQNVLGRAPDQAGADYWKQQFGDTVDDNERKIFMNAAQPELQQQGAQWGPPQSQSPNGKGGSSVNSYPGPQGMQGSTTYSATSGQPQMGAQNPYSNTVGQWDNTQIKPAGQGGKGKGV
jgi:Domain of unknown function (DUF4214)